MSNYTNELTKDVRELYKGRLHKPVGVIKFAAEKSSWFTIFDDWVIKRWQGKRRSNGTYVDGVNFAEDGMYWIMRPHLKGKGVFNQERKQTLIDLYNAKALRYADLITQSYFCDFMKQLKPNG